MGKNLFEKTLNVDRTEINFNKIKENKLNQTLNINNPFIQESKSHINHYDVIIENSENQKVKNVNITLYENDILKMKFITQMTGAKLSSFVRKCINEEYQKNINNKK
ncbi:hypothetical protein [Spiroplasma endosymbiont of Danaus chrysippus]|uniref:hypothetical protein n=1 Tax=Spiroplasma endosymbiont of Danaus chrysippus TaxID=2691041 RepID=UPI00157B4FDC|nr:hypothetical protein [Spiroplasma endosymbiont of Danaus chrysippus]